MTNELQRVGRIAFREDGDNWVAYFARENTMEGAIFLGAIKMNFVRGLGKNCKKRKKDFIDLMRACFSDVSEEVLGVRSVWGDPVPAPESERSGNT
jgi:hypothetical protein